MKKKIIKSFFSNYKVVKNYLYSWHYYVLASVGLFLFFIIFILYFLFIFYFNFTPFFFFELNSFLYFFNLSNFFFHFENLVFFFDNLKFLNCIVLIPK